MAAAWVASNDDQMGSRNKQQREREVQMEQGLKCDVQGDVYAPNPYL